jgi:IS5 family transposase
VLHAKALPGNPYDGHTLRAAIEDSERLAGREIERAYVDKGYRGHDAPSPHRVFISGEKGGVFGAIKREPRRRAAIEPVIGHMKAESHLGRCYLKGTADDAADANPHRHRPQHPTRPCLAGRLSACLSNS